MAGSAPNWEEKISRGTAIALMQNFSSIAVALKELVDNAINYRWNQALLIEIRVDLKADLLVVSSDGGRGMDANGVQVWLNWGEGDEHKQEDLSRWHQGGKAACGFLGSHVRLWAKAKDQSDVWFLEDEDWATRRTPKHYGPATSLNPESLPEELKNLALDRGHVRIELQKLNRDRRWNLSDLRRDLANTYRRLLGDGSVTIRIDGEDLQPFEFPLSSATPTVDIDVKPDKRYRVQGWAGRLQREKLTRPLKSGLRLVHSGRLIFEGEWFNYNHEGKGSLNSLIGEVEMRGFTPIPNKTDFVERSDKVWDAIGREVLEQLNPLISILRNAAADVPVTRTEKQRAREVAEELEKAFSDLRGTGGDEESQGSPEESGAGGRKPAQGSSGVNRSGEGPTHTHEHHPRTPPPEDSVGSLARIIEKITGGSKRPPIRISSWDPSERSTWSVEGKTTWLDINKNYHLYQSFEGSKPYVAETAILELCKPREGESASAVDYINTVNVMLLRWRDVASEG